MRLHKQLYPQPEGTVPIWVDDLCVTRSPIAKPGSFGDSIKIKALSRDLRNLGWALVHVRRKLLFMGDLDDIPFQLILQGIANDTVVSLGADNQVNLENNRVRITNNHEWS